jgi:pimeloyl-ACP methyl ester carboxylesterase
VKTRLRWGVALIGVGVLALLLSPLRERFLGGKRLRFPYLARPIPAERYDELAARPGWSKSEVEVAPGIRLRGLLRKPPTVAADWLLFYPGNDESQLERGQAFLQSLGGDSSLGLAVFAYRGYDASDGKPKLSDMQADAPEILARLCAAQGVEPARVHLIGFSIGGHFAVQAAAGAARRAQRAASLTLLASVDDIVMTHPSPWEYFSLGEDYQTRPFLSGVPEPVLVIQGTADAALAGPGQGRALAAALGPRGRYLELEGVEHVPLLQNAVALDAVREFVRQHTRPRDAL